GIVAARHGWWQACPELDLPGYDAPDTDSANINLVIGVKAADPVSGAAPHRCYPCEIEKLAECGFTRRLDLGHCRPQRYLTRRKRSNSFPLTPTCGRST
ncbi:MAG: hypothetical protein ACLPKW_34555, partial [Acetobacteraceae bacterium]